MSHNKQNKDDILHRPDEVGQLPTDIPRLPDVWYDQLQDPPDPPQREHTRAVIVTLNDDVVKKSFPSGEDLGEAPSGEDLGEAPSGEDLGEAPKASTVSI